MNEFAKSVYRVIQSLTLTRHFMLAFSGGMDSHVLLHQLAFLRKFHPQLKLRVLHIDHGLDKHSHHWAQHCLKVSQDLQIEAKVCRLTIPDNMIMQQGLESAARQLRYRTLAKALRSYEILMTAHHQEDQAETWLLQGLRGSGPQGLAAMPYIASFGPSYLMRPLLDYSRNSLLDYAKRYHLNFKEDPSNQCIRFNRNYIRKRIMPELKARWPSVTKTLARAATHCANAQQCIEQLARSDYEQVKINPGKSLSIRGLQGLSSLRQAAALRYWIQYKLGVAMPNCTKISQIQSDLIYSRRDKVPCVTWSYVQIRRYRDDLIAVIDGVSYDSLSSICLAWDFSQPLILPLHLGTLKAAWIHDKKPSHQSVFTAKGYTISFRQGGEKICIQKTLGLQSLKGLFQKWGVPPWLRAAIPLLYQGDNLIAVIGYQCSIYYQLPIKIDWCQHP